MKKKSLAFIHTAMGYGGVEKSIVNLFNNIDLEKYEITLWLKSIEGALLNNLPPEIKVRCYGDITPKDVAMDYLHKGKIFSLIKDIICIAISKLYSDNFCISNKYMSMVLPPLKEETYDYFFVYNGWDFRAMYQALHRFSAKKYVYWMHSEFNEYEKYYKKYIGKFDKIFCVSNSIKTKLEDSFGKEYKKNNIEVFYNIFDSEDIIRKANEPCDIEDYSLLTVGRLDTPKGQIMIPEITRKLLDRGYRIKWYIIGDGPTENLVRENIRKFNVENEVVLLGAKGNPYCYMKKCCIYVQPSFSEGYCSTTKEAQILKKPIVVTDVPGMREQFEDMINGVIVPSATPDALADGIKLLLDDVDFRTKLENTLSESDCTNISEINKLYRYLEKDEILQQKH